jgi:TonB-linked SusC/RagA family outer membrane protein
MKKITPKNYRGRWPRYISIVLVAVFMLSCNLFALAQAQKVSGKVTDAITGESLVGVSVYVKGTQNGTTTDVNGVYSVNNVTKGQILVFSFIGMKTTEIVTDARSTYDVVLQSEATGLDEVVVIGYGTQRKGDVTSSISTVKSDNFLKGSVKDAGQLIQGKVAGLSITTPSGNPSDQTQIMLRGITTLSGSTQPLILIDGIEGSLTSVAPEDIESIDVLKDGSAAAIYGTRGSNGVILITTKKVKGDMPATLEYSTYVSMQTIARQADFLNADDYRRLIAEGKPLNDYGTSTNWLDEVTRNPISQMHNISLKGGNLNTNYIATVNYNQAEGLFNKSYDNRLNTRLEVNHSMYNGLIKINAGIIGDNDKNFNIYPYRQALIRNPTDAIKDENGVWVEHPGVFQYENPVAWNEETFGENKSQTLRIHGSLLVEPIKGLRFKVLGSTNHYNYITGYSESKKHISNVRDGKNGYASRSAAAAIENLLEITGEYNKTIGKSAFTILGGYSYNDQVGENFYEDNYDFPTDAFSYNNMGTGAALLRGEASETSYKSSSKLIGFFGRINYNYAEKYLLMASVRQEGSSKFGENNKWGTFPALSAGWRISKESFLESAHFIDDLKIRAGYGVTGTEPTSSYMSLTRLTYSGYVLVNGEWVPQILPASNPNPDLKWEKKQEMNFGIDFSIYKGRVTGSVDYYIRTTKDMLWEYQVPSPPNLYSTIIANVGEMENKGLEAMISVIPVKTNDFQWTASLSYSGNKNKLVSLSNDLYQSSNDWFDTGYTGDPIQQSTHRVQVGQPIGNFYGVKSIDIDGNGVWVIEGADGQPKSINAKVEEDKQVIGNGLPKHYVGFNNILRYKNFDLNITMRGAFGFQILNFQRMFYENPSINIRYNVLSTAYDKVYGKQVLNYTQDYVSYYIEDGDYWKIDNVTFGYTLSENKISFLKNARIYFACLNTATITGYKGIDPEVNRMGLAPGDDERDKYPTTRTFSLGLNLTF